MRQGLVNEPAAIGVVPEIGLQICGAGSAAAIARPASADFRECSTTVKPSLTNRRAIAAPIPEVEPVTKATRCAGSLTAES